MKYLTKNAIVPIILLVFLLTANNSSAQSNSIEPDQRIIEAYGVNHTNDLKLKTPERIAYLNYFLDNSYEIRETPYHNEEKMTKVSEVSLNNKYTGHTRPTFDVNNFNVLLYNFKRNRKIKTQFRVDNTNKVIVFYAEEEIVKAFNQTK